MKKFDLIIIGSGPAGEKAACKAAYFGRKIALIEKAERFGGSGTQTGTLPSKTLKETALYLSGICDKGIYSIDRDFNREVSAYDFLYRKNMIAEIMGNEVHENLRRHNVQIFHGKGNFEDQHHIKISGHIEEVIYDFVDLPIFKKRLNLSKNTYN